MTTPTTDTRCELCGSQVYVVSGREGTNSYRPFTADVERAERARLAEQVRGLLRGAQPDDWYRRGKSEMVPAYEAVLRLLAPTEGGPE